MSQDLFFHGPIQPGLQSVFGCVLSTSNAKLLNLFSMIREIVDRVGTIILLFQIGISNWRTERLVSEQQA